MSAQRTCPFTPVLFTSRLGLYISLNKQQNRGLWCSGFGVKSRSRCSVIIMLFSHPSWWNFGCSLCQAIEAFPRTLLEATVFNVTESKLTMETELWRCWWGSFQNELAEVGRHTLTIGLAGTIPWAVAEAESNRGRELSSSYPLCFLTVDSMRPATSSACRHSSHFLH